MNKQQKIDVLPLYATDYNNLICAVWNNLIKNNAVRGGLSGGSKSIIHLNSEKNILKNSVSRLVKPKKTGDGLKHYSYIIKKCFATLLNKFLEMFKK